jgi:hypothetical protein
MKCIRYVFFVAKLSLSNVVFWCIQVHQYLTINRTTGLPEILEAIATVGEDEVEDGASKVTV